MNNLGLLVTEKGNALRLLNIPSISSKYLVHTYVFASSAQIEKANYVSLLDLPSR